MTSLPESPLRVSEPLPPPADAAARVDRMVLLALQGLVVAVPLLLGGRPGWVTASASAVVLVLLGLTIRERGRRGVDARVSGARMLLAFVGLALATTIPLPPGLLRLLASATARLYADTLPGWPGAGGWTTWRSLAIDPYAVGVEISRLSIGIGAFVIITAYPWRPAADGTDGRAAIFGRLLGTLMVTGVVFAGLGLLCAVAGNGNVLWITDAEAPSGQASGPFVNPNHFAAWLEMLIPLSIAYVLAVAERVRRQLFRTVDKGRGMGVRAQRAWITALTTHQRQLWGPLIGSAGVLLMMAAHAASGSPGGAAALLLGLAVTGAGITAAVTSPSAGGVRRWMPAGLALVLILASAIVVARWSASDEAAGVDATDVSLANRIAVAAAGGAIVRDHPLFGTGLGSWLHAFRPYQAPPVEGGIWDHAYNDYVELAAESGILGVGLVLLFGLAVAGALWLNGDATAEWLPPRRRRPERGRSRAPEPPEQPEWRLALREASLLRWGLAGGVVALLAHSLIEFGLRMPANQLTLMVLLALLVLTTRPEPAESTRPLALLAVLLAAALIPQADNTIRLLAGALPLSPADCIDRADRMLAEQGDGARGDALALVRRALDRAPADREAHEALADVLPAGPESEAALRRALALNPWSAELRDRLGLRLWARGEQGAGAAELEESIYHFPYLVSHAYLTGDSSDLSFGDPGQLVHALVDGDTLKTRLATLESGMADALDRGLGRALADTPVVERRMVIVSDVATLLESRERWAAAATALRAEAAHGPDGAGSLARAARDYLKAEDHQAAEQTLLAALQRAGGRGNLYRLLAVDVYASRGDFMTAENVLRAGQRNAVTMLPVYQGVTEVLARQEASRADEAVTIPEPPAVPPTEDVP